MVFILKEYVHLSQSGLGMGLGNA